MLSLAVSTSPAMVTGTSSAVPSFDGTGSPTAWTSFIAPSRCLASAAADCACAWSSLPCRAVMSTFSLACSSKWPSATIVVARPDSPIAVSASVASLVPTHPPAAKHTATKTTHKLIARHGCVALHLATRTVTGCLPTDSFLSPANPVVRQRVYGVGERGSTHGCAPPNPWWGFPHLRDGNW